MGATHDAAIVAVNSAFEKWRMVYCGATAYQDGPALSNQGTVAAAQFTAMPRLFTATTSMGGLGAGGLEGQPLATKLVESWQAGDTPDFTALQSMPNAYFGESKDGCYMPLRLSANHQEWHGPNDNHMLATLHNPLSGYIQSGASTTQTDLAAAFPMISANNSEACYSNDLTALIAGWTSSRMKNSSWLPDATGYGCIVDGNTIAGSATVTKLVGSLVNAPCNDLAGRMCFRGLSVSTQVVVYLRVGFEVMVQPGTSYAPYLRLSPVYDPAALVSYYKISRELKDAYPADYNDEGKLWDTIKSAARVVLPAAGALIPGMAPLASVLAGMASRSQEQKAPVMVAPPTKHRDSLPAALVERAQYAKVRGASGPKKKKGKKKT